jgi:Ulp1 family protease
MSLENFNNKEKAEKPKIDTNIILTGVQVVSLLASAPGLINVGYNSPKALAELQTTQGQEIVQKESQVKLSDFEAKYKDEIKRANDKTSNINNQYADLKLEKANNTQNLEATQKDLQDTLVDIGGAPLAGTAIGLGALVSTTNY